MTGAHENRHATRVALDCGHDLWLYNRPGKDEILWCQKCQRYEPLMLTAGSRHGTYYDPAGEFCSTRVGSQFKGECLYDLCTYTYTSRGYDGLRTNLHHHYMSAHTRFGTLNIKTGTRPPRNSPPPF